MTNCRQVYVHSADTYAAMPEQRSIPTYVLLILLLGSVVGPHRAAAQSGSDTETDAGRFFPRQGFMLSGYGGAGYDVLLADGSRPNDFSAVFAPIMLFQISDRFLFEGELEFEIEEGATETGLEYAQIDMAATNNLTLIAGKFLLPFNVFSERLHPTWINRLVSSPALYGGHGALTPTDPLVPMLSDVGIQLRGAFAVGRFSTITAEAFVTQGPMPAADEHAEEPDEAGDGHQEAPAGGTVAPDDLAFGSDFTDNNEDKMIGGRIGFGVAPHVEFNISGMTGAFDAAGDLRFSALGAHLESRYRNFTVHGEFIQTWQDVAEADAHDEEGGPGGAPPDTDRAETAVETLARNGYWMLLSYRWRKWQPVVRWTQVFESDIDGTVVTAAGRQLAIGLDYWFEPALAIKLEYLINDEEHPVDNNRLAVQLAFGF